VADIVHRGIWHRAHLKQHGKIGKTDKGACYTAFFRERAGDFC
jgi:hypothetical protein